MARPSKPLLSRQIIADAALALIDASGPEALGMRQVARQLDVHPTSLYNHIENRVDLVEEIRGRIAGIIDHEPLRSKGWSEGVSEWAASYRAAFAKHPRAIPLLMSTSAASPVVLANYESFAVGALRAGWSDEDIVPLLTAIESFILGSVLDMSGPSAMFDPSGQESTVPTFSRAFTTAQERPSGDSLSDRAFLLGLAGLIKGLNSMREEPAQR